MSIQASTALSTTAFEKTRVLLNSFDDGLNPLCKIELLAIGPRVMQIALNSLALADALVSSAVLSLVCFTPLYGQVQGWRNDAWTLTAELAHRIALLIIAVIPYAGSSLLSSLEESQASEKRLCGEITGLKATSDSYDRSIARLLKEKEALKVELDASHEKETKAIEILKAELDASHEKEIKATEGYKREKATLTEAHETAMATEKEDFSKEIRKLKDEHGQEIAALTKNAAEEKAAIERNRDALSMEKEVLNTKCQDLQKKLEDVTELASQLKERILPLGKFLGTSKSKNRGQKAVS